MEISPHLNPTTPLQTEPRPADASWLRRVLLTIAASAVGAAIHTREGLFSESGILWIHLAVAATLVAALSPAFFSRLRPRPTIPTLVLAAALLFQFVQLYQSYPGTIWNAPRDDPRHRAELSVLKDQVRWIEPPDKQAAARRRIADLEESLRSPRFQSATLAAALLSTVVLVRRPWIATAAFLLLLAAHFAMGAALLRASPDPFIDVFVFQQESCAALLDGRNPYAITFTNIYGPGAYVYGPGLTAAGRVNFGYPYMPITLLMALPGYLLAADHRYAQLAALTLSGLLIAFSGKGPIPRLAALLLLFSPRAFMVIELSWTEPLVILLLSLTLFVAVRFPLALPVALGLFLASKQYLVFALPLCALLLSRDRRSALRSFAIALFVAAVVSLPLMVWDPRNLDGLRAFIHSAVTLQLKQPFRQDSLSYPAWVWWHWSQNWAPRLTLLAFIAAIGAVVVALRRCPRGPGGFAAALALVYLAFLIFSKQAFCNYYFFVLAALCWAVAILPSINSPAARSPHHTPAPALP